MRMDLAGRDVTQQLQVTHTYIYIHTHAHMHLNFVLAPICAHSMLNLYPFFQCRVESGVHVITLQSSPSYLSSVIIFQILTRPIIHSYHHDNFF